MIYQLFVRHFGNVCKRSVLDGSIEQNGCGKFEDITNRALVEIKAMGFTHLWLTGVLEQASATEYPERQADDALLLKGKAGSPYAIRDFFDVSPDYAVNPTRRLEEFEALLGRCQRVGLRVIIDLVPNHVARSYASDVRPDLDFGKGDDTGLFFSRDNNFYYLDEEGELLLPGGEYAAEGVTRVTGNNAATHQPTLNDWYETVKLNYGHDYRRGRETGHLPAVGAELESVPNTWRKMDQVISYWQGLGVGGFRCDMAHMVPMEFWAWALDRAQTRDDEVYFMAEAYDGDPAKLTDNNVQQALLDSGFQTVYDGESYELVKGIYEGSKWANDLDALLWDPQRLEKMLRYSENHDEVRLASPQHWGGHGAEVGRSVTAWLSAVSSAPFMLYNGQEVGEDAVGETGFSGDDGRSSIFDYGHLPALQKWVNSGRFDGAGLSQKQMELRNWYVKWLSRLQHPAFSEGGVYGLNQANRDNEHFRIAPDEEVGGRWVYAFVRYDWRTAEGFLVVINFHPERSIEQLTVEVPADLEQWCDKSLKRRYSLGSLPACGVDWCKI